MYAIGNVQVSVVAELTNVIVRYSGEDVVSPVVLVGAATSLVVVLRPVMPLFIMLLMCSATVVDRNVTAA